ncbi:MAG: NAD-dependent deacylase [Bacteroidetes bacterium]|nr:NAD-dependent deacylase [Bacteroidota bacterium]
MKNQKLVVLTGAGISAESGLKTFRDSDGLWEGYNIEEVATPEAWHKNPSLVQQFYNERRKAVLEAEPNKAHVLLAELEEQFNVHIITQNIDNLHERAGSNNILHLHGEIVKSRSTFNSDDIYPIKGWELKMGDLCNAGYQLRPHIVWFGESVPLIEPAKEIVSDADIFVIIGTSLQVYPAAGLINYTKPKIPIYVIDPKQIIINNMRFQIIQEKAETGVEQLIKILNSKI